MQIIADLHIHSKYSRATSQHLDLEEISLWAQKKGIELVGTGDFTHPLWYRELTTRLVEKEVGIYSIKPNKAFLSQNKTCFILTSEISSIYSHNGKVRKVHNVVFSPDLLTVDKIIKRLNARGAKLMSDGRPIVGISSHDLLELLLDVDERIFLVPAHIWTPHFSLFGSMSGYDSVKECFGDLEKNIYAIETGLSSDPIMNWGVAELTHRSIISSSDAHSGPKLGREATVFVPKTNAKLQIPNSKFSYKDIIQAIKQTPNSRFVIGYTIEFFPEEGKYHWSGHRNCGVRLSPSDIEKTGALCPICKKAVTIGVEERTRALSNRICHAKDIVEIPNKNGLVFVRDKEGLKTPFVSLVPLIELIHFVEPSPKKSQLIYENLIEKFHAEFAILMSATYSEIENVAGSKIASAIVSVRGRKVKREAGYDGVFGTITPSNADEYATEKTQQCLF